MIRQISKATALLQEKQSRTHAERRDEAERRLLDAAAQLVADRGVDGLTLADVGEAAGYSRGLPRHYFGKKNDLVGALARYVADRFAQNLARGSAARPGMESLMFAVESYFNGAAASPQNTRALLVVIAESLREAALLPAMAAVTDRSVARLATHIRRGITRGEIRSDVDAQTQAQIILATLRTAVMQWMIDPEHVDLAATRDAFVVNLRRALSSEMPSVGQSGAGNAGH